MDIEIGKYAQEVCKNEKLEKLKCQPIFRFSHQNAGDVEINFKVSELGV